MSDESVTISIESGNVIMDITKLIQSLEAENERLQQALKFYADGKHWDYPCGPGEPKVLDHGEVARKALEVKK